MKKKKTNNIDNKMEGRVKRMMKNKKETLRGQDWVI